MERSAALKKRAAAITLEGPLAPQRIFNGFHGNEAVKSSLAGKQSCLAPVLIVGGITEDPHARSTADQRGDAGGGKRIVMADG